ncbi:hypothetical protein [Pedobacter sp. N23S346]|uniref:hypothetical protein n=1 Tax=Pedobacter sp. N23S346 TaxID=3402750 RepID=UPI003ACAC37C
MTEKIKTSATEMHPPFKTLIAQLVQAYAPLQIYRFAKLTKKGRANSVFSTAQLQKQRTYYLLMITEGSEAIESEVQDFADGAFAAAKVIVQVYGQATLLKHVNHRNGYFAAIVNGGKLCYGAPGGAGVLTLLQPNQKNKLGRAIVHWRNRSQMADGFLLAAEKTIGQDHVGLFLLHQATEQACMGLIFVFMDHLPNLRNLDRLLYLCACFSPKPLAHFFGNAENEVLLNIMMKNVSRQCYQHDFSLEGNSIGQFMELVTGFLGLAKFLCKERFALSQRALAEVVSGL